MTRHLLRRLLAAIRHLPCRWQHSQTRVVRKDGEMYETCQCGWRSGGWDVPRKEFDFKTQRAVRIVGRIADIRSRRRRQG